MKQKESYFLEILKEHFESELRKTEDKFIHEVSVWVVKQLLLGEKYDVDYSDDPPWDHSGKVFSTGKPYNVEDYDTLEEFFEEYNGHSSPTFTSGCGMYHDRYSENLEEWTREFVHDIVCKKVEEYYKKNEEFQTWAKEVVTEEYHSEQHFLEDLVIYVCESELDDYIYSDMVYDLIHSIHTIDVASLFDEEKEKVIEQLEPSEKEELHLSHLYNNLFQQISEKNGLKVITIVLYSGRTQVFELENNRLTSNIRINSRSHYEQFKLSIMDGMKHGGAITLRQFTPLQIEKDGKMIPIKKIYGIRLGENNWEGVSKEEIEVAHCTDAQTGLPLPKEKAVEYASFC